MDTCPAHTHTYANTPHIIFEMLHNSPNFMLFYKTPALNLSLFLPLWAQCATTQNNFNSHCCCCCCGCRQTKKKKEKRFSISNRKCVYSAHLSTPTTSTRNTWIFNLFFAYLIVIVVAAYVCFFNSNWNRSKYCKLLNILHTKGKHFYFSFYFI